MTILDTICDRKRKEVAISKRLFPVTQLEHLPLFKRTCPSFSDSIKNRSGFITEFKRKSPSKGLINGEVIVEDVVSGYDKAGASAISVLTDTNFFGGTLNDLLRARSTTDLPLLKKDFIVDSYQLTEAKAFGADVILLIAAALNKEECHVLAKQAKDLGLNVFLELHNEEELEHFCNHVDAVGINNRNLKTFKVDIENSIRLADQLPKNVVKVAESGISSIEVVHRMHDAGFEGFLMGEHFMRSEYPSREAMNFIKGAKLNSFIENL